MKTCFKCQQLLPLECFYPHPQMKDGRLNKCKGCAKKDTAARAAALSNDPKWVETELERHREKSRRMRAEGRVAPVSIEKKRETIKRHAAKYPERHLARKMVTAAIKAGLLTSQPCHCGAIDSEAHHDDYSKPLVVLWLCPKHHAERHVELRKLQRQKLTQ